MDFTWGAGHYRDELGAFGIIVSAVSCRSRLRKVFVLATWEEFAKSAPILASYGKRRLHSRVAYLGTSRPDGAPRVHPVSPFIADGHLYVYMEPSSPKGQDLRRNPWYAMHCAVEDSGGGRGEFLVRGQARVVEDSDVREKAFAQARAIGFHPRKRYVLFGLSVAEVISTAYEGGEVKRTKWKSTQE